MKTDIHPTYYPDAKITCMSCGVAHKVGSTTKEIKVEVCSQCHPFYTGKQDHLLDTTGRVDKFKAKMEKAKAYRKKMGMEEPADPPQTGDVPAAASASEAPKEEASEEKTDE